MTQSPRKNKLPFSGQGLGNSVMGVPKYVLSRGYKRVIWKVRRGRKGVLQ